MLTSAQLEELDALHRQRFARFVWTDDRKMFRVIERWEGLQQDGDNLIGDCDDWAIDMHRLAGRIGVAMEDRRLAACSIDPAAEPYDHCVLILIGAGKLYVSECNSPTIVALAELPYTNYFWAEPRKIQSAPWERIPQDLLEAPR